jgi:hypothetical protein
MACPYFEPQRVVMEPTHFNARLPLIEEFDGVCRAQADPLPVPAGARLRLCNHGNACGQCGHFPADSSCSSVRFEVLRRSPGGLDLLFVKESRYTPISWDRVTFSASPERLEPEPLDVCQHAQLLAFCRSYLRRYSS